MRIIFMGSPEFAVPTLDALLASDHEIIAVYSQPPRPAGRGKQDRPTPVHARAETAGIELRTPLNFRDPADIAAFAALDADLAIVVAYGLILPSAILDAPRLGCVNLHASLLPRWRGAAPIHRAIMSGDSETGICLMQMEEGLDTGPVLAHIDTPIAPDDRTPELHDRLAEMAAGLLMNCLDDIDNLIALPQPEEGVTYAAKIDKAEARIDWNQPAEAVMRHIHALTPFPGAWSIMEGERIKFHRVEIVDGAGAAGEILDEQMTIACGTGAIRPLEIQREGKRAMAIGEALRGMSAISGKKLADG